MIAAFAIVSKDDQKLSQYWDATRMWNSCIAMSCSLIFLYAPHPFSPIDHTIGQLLLDKAEKKQKLKE